MISGIKSERIVAGLAVAGLHVAALLLLISGGGAQMGRAVEERLTIFDIAAPAPPPPPPPPADAAVPEAGRAAPENRRAQPVPIVAPPPRIATPETIAAAPVADSGREAEAGASDRYGPGTGSGGAGEGRGSGGEGGIVTRAALIAGEIVPADYPRAAWRSGVSGTVRVRFVVTAQGIPRSCRVMTSSGHAALDDATCALIEARFRYAPARDAAGQAVAEERAWMQRWWGARD